MADETTTKEEKTDWESCNAAHPQEIRHKHNHHYHAAGYAAGPLWCIGWLFTIGYLHLPFFWKGVLAIVIWPYYLGDFLRSVAGY